VDYGFGLAVLCELAADFGGFAVGDVVLGF
jgi:hypothetical protein